MSVSEYDIIKTPLVSEKLHDLSSKGIYGFRVSKDATRVQVKRAVEKVYNVRVEKVNIMNKKGKSKRLRGKIGYTSSWKKAIVKLIEGQEITTV